MNYFNNFFQKGIKKIRKTLVNMAGFKLEQEMKPYTCLYIQLLQLIFLIKQDLLMIYAHITTLP